MDPTKRPIIVHVLDIEILPAYLTQADSFEDLHSAIYCTAVATAQLNGGKIFHEHSHEKQKTSEAQQCKTFRGSGLQYGLKKLPTMTKHLDREGHKSNQHLERITEDEMDAALLTDTINNSHI
ncbi:hypothetical protein WA026_015472 [Henosepilachna vigintioctopunctata]|uniref:Uncharacterized protein n=1 Tax=Henosepilachna vigintioctopunctata TaxID=420089 RepID=A0AAW1UMV7_9CUCU